jgi:DNA-binding beta-propeller fold protein YncE
MGVVYRATQISLGRPVALKVIASALSEQPGFRERFERESRIAASLDHPNVIPVYAAGEYEGIVYIAMRYVEGTDLRALIGAEGRLEPARAARVVAQVAWALDAAHQRGLVHRDVKPANVLVTDRGDLEHVYLTDFGLTKRYASDSGLTAAGEWVGTVDYVAPEQLRGDHVDARADVYALGCVLYEALTGRVPFPRDNELAKLWGHMSDRPTSAAQVVPDVSRKLADVAERAMAKSTNARYETAGKLARAALAAAPASTPSGQPASRAARVASRVGLAPEGRPARRRLLALAAVVALAAAAAVAAVLASGGDEASRLAGAGPAATSSSAGAVIGSPIRVGDSPAAVAVGEGAAWVANRGDQTVTRLDLRSGRPVGDPTAVGEDPSAIAVGAGGVWVVNAGDGTVTRIDPDSGRASGGPIAVGARPTDVAVGSGSVWVATETGDIARIDPRTGRVAGPPIRVHAAGTLAVGLERLWISDELDGTVRSIDTPSRVIVDRPIPVGDQPTDLAVGRDDLWVAVAGEREVRAVDLRSGLAVGRAIRVHGRPEALALRRDALWVIDTEAETVDRFDARTGRLVGRPIPVGEDPAGIAVDRGTVWVTSAGDDTVTRIRAG